MKKQQDLTEGVIWKQVLLFFIPLVIGAFFQHFYTIVDTMIIGKALGTTELSAVGGSASKLIVLYTNFFIGVSSGITAYASRYFGEKNYKSLRLVLVHGTCFFVIFGILLSIVGILGSEQYFLWMNTPTSTLESATIYLHTYLYGIVFTVMYNTFAGILRALGDSTRPLYVLVFCSILNVCLDILFVFQFSMGVFGIALATLIAQGCSAFLLGILIVKTMKKYDSSPLQFDISYLKNIVILGIPAGLQSIMFSLSNMAVQSGVNGFGESSVAAWTAYVKLDSIADLFLSSLASTVIPFVGQNLGAGKFERIQEALKQIMLLSGGILFVLLSVFLWQREFLLSLFTYDDEVVLLGGQVMWVVLPMYLLAIPQQIYAQALRGLGNSFGPMMFTLVGVVGLRLCWVTFFLPSNPSLLFLAACYPTSAFVMSCIFTVYYKKEFATVRKKMELVHKNNGTELLC